MTSRTAEALIDTPCHVLEADKSAGMILRDLNAAEVADETLLVLVDGSDVVGTVTVGQLKGYVVENPDLARELGGNLVGTIFETCRTQDPEKGVAALMGTRKPDVILVSGPDGRIHGAIRNLPN